MSARESSSGEPGPERAGPRATNDHALLSAAEMQSVDARAIADGVDGFALMRRAGEAVARHVRRLAAPDAHVAVVAGPGNNGGDGAVAARALVDAGFDHVVLIRAGGDARPGSDAARAFADWTGTTLRVDGTVDADTRHAIADAHVVVDALLGAGLGRDVDGPFADLVQAMDTARRDRGACLLAVDLPSGLDGDTHAVRGIAAGATLTVTFVRAKVAHVLYPGRALCGRTVVEEIDMPPAAVDAVLEAAAERCDLNDPALWRHALPCPEAMDHKFRRGHVLVRGGPPHQTGAARLSADAALRGGAGLVTLALRRDALPIAAAHLTAVMLRPANALAEWRALLDDERLGALVIGPGNGVDRDTADAVDAALGSGHPCVVDADGLTAHAATGKEGAARLLDALRGTTAPVVLTPHEGEFERLFDPADLGPCPSRLHRARAAAALARTVVVLKGPDTVVAGPDGRATINANAPPWLATAGAGDVLAGLVAAFLAQGMIAFDAASAAVWLHAEAARTLGWPLSAEQLAPAAARELRRLTRYPPPVLPRLAIRKSQVIGVRAPPRRPGG